MSADSRSITTDALTVLGTIIDESVGRDAIHLAVEPVIASMPLRPGQRITLSEGIYAVGVSGREQSLGIVDPFLTRDVQQGERFLMVLNPRQIATLRHVWDHPAFPPSDGGGAALGVAPAAEPDNKVTEIEAAQQWLTVFAANAHVSYDEMLKETIRWSEHSDQPWWWEYEFDENEFFQKINTAHSLKLTPGYIDLSCRGC